MGKQGRKRMPQALKEATHSSSANRRSRGALSPRPPAIPHTPPPPAHIHALAQEEWARVAPLMVEVGMLTELDLAPLVAYCEAFATFRVASEKLAALAVDDPSSAGLIVRSPGGAVYLNPLQAVKAKAARDMVSFAAELGLTPAGRAGIVVAERGGMGRTQPVPVGRAKGVDLVAKYSL
jgi:P27 family predicted phage terminase small subunit